MKVKDIMDRVDLLIEVNQQVKEKVEEKKREEDRFVSKLDGKPFSEEEMEKIKANYAGWW
jgi:hypothetical protein